MPLYEHVYMARQDLGAQQVDELTNQYKAVLEQMGGKVAKAEYWGVKSLTYRIRKNRKAHFTLMNVDAPPAALAEVERQERLNEDVLRYLTLRVDQLDEAPSAVMQSRGSREDRPRRDRDRYGEGRERYGEPRDAERPADRPAERAVERPPEPPAPAETDKVEA